MTRRSLAFLAFAVFDLLLLALFVGLFLLRQGLAETELLSELGVARFEEAVVLDDFALTDQRGNAFTKSDILGRWHLVFFGFTSCPDVCPMAMQGLGSFYRNLEKVGLAPQPGVIMVSVDPLRDSPQVLASYVESFHPEFIGLTGNNAEIASLAKQLFVAFSEPPEHDIGHSQDDYLIRHSDYIAVIDPTGRLHSVIHPPHRAEKLMQAYLAISD